MEIKEIEETYFKEHRDRLLKTYENRLKKGKEEIERLKRDIEGYKQMFLKNIPTPQRSQCEMLHAPFTEALEFFTRTVFQLLVFCKMASLERVHPGSKKMKFGSH
jgi:hypothetical protein